MELFPWQTISPECGTKLKFCNHLLMFFQICIYVYFSFCVYKRRYFENKNLMF